VSAAVYAVRPEVSAVLIEARSNVGPIELATTEQGVGVDAGRGGSTVTSLPDIARYLRMRKM